MKIILAVTILILVVNGAPLGKKQPPHLVFVLIDDMGFNDFYTSSDLSAAWPNVKNLAGTECLKLDKFYTQPICTPSRGSFMTGRMPIRLGLQHGVINGVLNYGLPLNETTLPDKLRAAGYKTYGVGKWHLGMYNNASTPTERGFDHFYGYFNGYEDYFEHSVALGSAPTNFPVVDGYLDLHDDKELVRDLNGTYGPDIFAERAAAYIKTHKASAGGAPMFLYMAMQNVHVPLEAMPEDLASPACRDIPNTDRKTFCGMARSADRAIGNLTQTLQLAFEDEEFLIVMAGDNGGEPSGAGNNCPDEKKFCLRGRKATLWEGGIRNNALVCSPTMLPQSLKGKEYNGMVHLMDIHATFADLGTNGATPKLALDGESMWNAFTSGAKSPRDEFIINIDPCSGHGACQGVEAGIRSGDWKYMSGVSYETWYPLPTTENNSALASTTKSLAAGLTTSTWLFNVTADPGETMDLSNRFPQVVQQLQAKIDAAAEEAMPPCNMPGGSCSSEDQTGYQVIKAAKAWVPWAQDEL